MTNSETIASSALPYRDTGYLDALRDGVLIFDGAMGTNIQRYNLTADDFGGRSLEGCNDNLVLTRPDVIQAARRVGVGRQGARDQRRGGAAWPSGV
jgi:hypothetical protein